MPKAILAIALLILAAPAFAQEQPEHPVLHHKKVHTEIVLSSDTMFGTTLLKAGKYTIDCDHVVIRITSVSGDVLDLAQICEGREMALESPVTRLETSIGADGIAHVDKLYLRGSNIEHVFIH